MTRRIGQSGIKPDKALAMERHLKAYGLSEKLISLSPPEVLGPLIKASIVDTQAIQLCIGETTNYPRS